MSVQGSDRWVSDHPWDRQGVRVMTPSSIQVMGNGSEAETAPAGCSATDQPKWRYPCVASATSGQKASAKMRDFDLLQAPRRRSEVDEQTRTSTIYGGAETGDFTRGGSARRNGERGVPTAWIGG